MCLAESMLGYQPVCLLCYWSPFSCYFCIYSEDWWYGRLDYVLLLCNYDKIYIDMCFLHVPGPLVGNHMCYGCADICFGRDDASNQLEWRGTPLTSYATINGMHALSFLLMELDRSCERWQPFFLWLWEGTAWAKDCTHGAGLHQWEKNAELIATYCWDLFSKK